MHAITLTLGLLCLLLTSCAEHRSQLIATILQDKETHAISCVFDHGAVSTWDDPWGKDDLGWAPQKPGRTTVRFDLTDFHLQPPYRAYVSKDGSEKKEYFLLVANALSFFPVVGAADSAPDLITIFPMTDGEGHYAAALSRQYLQQGQISADQFWGRCKPERENEPSSTPVPGQSRPTSDANAPTTSH